jgi:gluconate 5-dehydrogenase
MAARKLAPIRTHSNRGYGGGRVGREIVTSDEGLGRSAPMNRDALASLSCSQSLVSPRYSSFNGRESPMSLTLFDLTGRTALITGSSQGIGLALAAGLGRAGASIVLNGRDQAKLEQARVALAAQGLSIHAAAFDVSDPKAVEAAIANIETSIGPIDILINNAGKQHRAPAAEFPDEAWADIFRVNVDSAFYAARSVGRRMIERQRGKIINIGSVQSELGRPTIVPYATTKGAIKMMTRGLAAEWAKHNIQVNAIGPGYFKTPLNQALVDNPDFSAWLCARTPAGRWGDVDELVGAAIFLASDASNFVNGHMVMVDGGLTSAV